MFTIKLQLIINKKVAFPVVKKLPVVFKGKISAINKNKKG